MKDAYQAYLYGVILMLLAIALGAFGAHVFEPQLVVNNRIDVYNTANKYHFYQALGLLMIGAIAERNTQLILMKCIIYLLISGVLIFSGSLYLLALLNIAWLGAITPLGGLCMLLGWGLLLVSLFKQSRNQRR